MKRPRDDLLHHDNLLHHDVLRVLYLIKSHEKHCTNTERGNGDHGCHHVQEIRTILKRGCKRWIGRLDCCTRYCRGTWWTLEQLLRHEPFCVSLPARGSIRSQEVAGLVDLTRPFPESFNARDLSKKFIINFLLARPFIAGRGFDASNGGYDYLFEGAPVLGSDCQDAPSALQNDFWVRLKLPEEFKPRGALDLDELHKAPECRLGRRFYHSAFECLASELVHGLSGTGDDNVVKFTKVGHEPTMKVNADTVLDQSTGYFWSVAWEVFVDVDQQVSGFSKRQCGFPRKAIKELHVWLRALPSNREIMIGDGVSHIRLGFCPLLEHAVD